MFIFDCLEANKDTNDLQITIGLNDFEALQHCANTLHLSDNDGPMKATNVLSSLKSIISSTLLMSSLTYF